MVIAYHREHGKETKERGRWQVRKDRHRPQRFRAMQAGRDRAGERSCGSFRPEVRRQGHAAFSGKAGNGMTPLPRNIPSRQSPVSNRAGRHAESVGNSLHAPKLIDQFLSHATLSQIVTVKASPKSHSLCVASFALADHNADMDDQDKNGGPNHLRAWRVFRGLSQAALAEKVGTNANMIQYLETGERGLSAKWLRRLAPALDTTPGMLLDHDPDLIDPDLLDIWGHASRRERVQIAEIAKALIKTGTDG